ncbi:hypothetical protein A1O3_03645 [Capronia epimyces CBS 606.96]|uniref:Phenylacetaldoxime dehydratase n=1 Tax=Capronia epimyces CBS 606.96 TaxID=1182542 RepID=W9Y1J9_9EURO|nr:uncharacterized protein A1O3_03645 [Capronia epimyces CBS 606.96]EXJ86692.1 hypothetical protein A1O3_03645 [Capronia epimyces CBS 606.96]
MRLAPGERREHSLRRPTDHKVSNLRWTVIFPEDVEHVYTLYLGVQSHGSDQKAAHKAEESIEQLLKQPVNAPASVEVFRVILGNDLPASTVWVAHWTLEQDFSAKLKQLDLQQIWQASGSGRNLIGIWRESFETPLERLQTNYSRQEYSPGLARLPNVTTQAHDYTEYWGAGRDRLAAFSHDLFELPAPPSVLVPQTCPRGFGQRLVGQNYNNMCHIRSGQYWGLCGPEETEAYENGLQQKLVRGMKYLWENPEETGTIGLRFARSLDTSTDRHPLRETSAMGFHRNWADLEKWAARHPSHLAIFSGAMEHNKKFGDARRFMTWQEVSILKAGEASFEYVNCDPRTGVIKWVELSSESLASARGSRL